MINVEFLDRWDEFDGSRYLILIINDGWYCTVKDPPDSGMYVMQYEDGNEAEHRTGYSFRVLTDEERNAALKFAEDQFRVEAMLDEAHKRKEIRL